MCTLNLFIVLLFALLLLGILAFILDVFKEKEVDNPNYPTRAYKVVKGCSYIVKFGMILTACALVGSLSSAAGLGLAMAFAVPKPTRVPDGSWFDHSHNVATTIPFGAVVPVDWRFLMPAERVKQNISGFCRALMLKAPAMQDVDLKYATYFVPLRLLNEKTEAIISAPKDWQLPTSSTTFLQPSSKGGEYFDPVSGLQFNANAAAPHFPYITLNGAFYDALVKDICAFKKVDQTNDFDFDSFYDALRSSSYDDKIEANRIMYMHIGSLADYLGFPVMTDDEMQSICRFYSSLSSETSALKVNFDSVPLSLVPFQAYHAICNHFFVPDFQRRSALLASDVTDSTAFTPIVDIRSDWNGIKSYNEVCGSGLFALRYSQYESDPYTFAKDTNYVSRVNLGSCVDSEAFDDKLVFNANSIRSIFDLDEFARKVERFYGDMRKQIKYMFGIITSDKSAMSPVLVDAGSVPIGVSEVQNTSLAPVNDAQSQSLGKMTAALGKQYDTFIAEEHGVLMTCVWIRPRTAYMNKLPFMFGQCLDFPSFPNPLFAEVGDIALSAYDIDYNPFGWLKQQADSGDVNNILSREGSHFGYNSRYVQWKYTLDSVTGDFRGPLAYWTCARDFDEGAPYISDTGGSDFLTCGPQFNLINGAYDSNTQPLNRIFALVSDVPNVRPFQLQLRFNTQIWQLYPHIEDEM